MTLMLEFKEKLKNLYVEYSHILLPIGKFVLALITFMAINHTLGFLPILTNIFVVLILALICCLLPVNMIAVVGGAMIIAHGYALGIEVAGVTLLLLILIAVFFLRFVSKDALAMILTPLAFAIGIPCVIPICYGLKRRPSSAIAVGCGTVVYFYLRLLNNLSATLKGTDNSEIIIKVRLLMDGIIKNQTMFLNLLAMVIVLVLVYAIRRTGRDYAWRIATFIGVVAYLAVMILGGFFMDIDTSLVLIIVGALVAGLVASLIEFFMHNVDYSRSEHLEYEDDEYYYYVKAVPKMSITTAKRQIKTISGGEEEYKKSTESYINLKDDFTSHQSSGIDGGSTVDMDAVFNTQRQVSDGDDLFGETREAVDVDAEVLKQKLEESLKDL